MAIRVSSSGVLPGFGPALAFTLLYLTLLILIPLSTLVLRSSSLSLEQFWSIVTEPRVVASFRVSFTTALIAAAANLVIGFTLAWALVRYNLPGKRLIDALIDLPFALPTAVAGIVLTAVYSGNGWIGQFLEPLGFKVAYTPTGIVVALIFIGLPFVVRTVEPVLRDIEPAVEEVAANLGASRWQVFARVLLPNLVPALLTGFALAFARGLGEYGSVIFIAGNMPMVSEIVPLLIVTKLEQYDYPGATAVALAMLILSFALLFAINLLERWMRRRSDVRETE
jgi:sulfate transport system permease protein